MRRRIRYLMLATVTLMLLAVPALAIQTKVYELDELDLSVGVPEGLIVVTRDNDPGISFMDVFGETRDQLLAEMTANRVYLLVQSADYDFQINVTMSPCLIGDFNQYGDSAVLAGFASSFSPERWGVASPYTGSEIYQGTQAKFVRSRFIASGTTLTSGAEYITVYADRPISFDLICAGEVTDRQQAILKEIVDSAVFGTAPLTADSARTGPFAYIDPMTLASFIVPEGWYARDVSPTAGQTNLSMVCPENFAVTLNFESMDIWARLPSSETAGHSRDGYSYLPGKQDLTQLFNITEPEVTKATYNGRDYSRCAFDVGSTSAGVEYNVRGHLITLARVENGYIYLLAFTGIEADPFYPAFEELMNSVAYP